MQFREEVMIPSASVTVWGSRAATAASQILILSSLGREEYEAFALVILPSEKDRRVDIKYHFDDAFD